MTHIRQRYEFAEVWALENPTLYEGEVGWERDTGRAKLGNGYDTWADLDYVVEPGGTVSYVAGKAPDETGNVSLSKADVGLPLVNNTPDASKPVSVPQQAALNEKAPLDSPAFTGTPSAPTPAPGDNDTSIATTAFVQTAAAAAATARVAACSIKALTPQAIPNAAWTRITLGETEFDTGAMADLANGAIAAPADGIYLVGALISFPASSAGRRYVNITKSSTDSQTAPNAAVASAPSISAIGIPTFSPSTLMAMTAGEKVYLWAYQDSGGALSLASASNYLARLWLTRVG